jgi:hypothetical protein
MKLKIFNTKGHGEIVASSISSDCLPYGATTNVISYTKAIQTVGSKGRTNMKDPNLLLHPSQMEVGTISWITKREPTGRGKLNPFLTFGSGTVISPNNKLKKDINNLKELLVHHAKLSNIDIIESEDDLAADL